MGRVDAGDVARAVGKNLVEPSEDLPALSVDTTLPTVLHVIPGLFTGGAENMLASLVATKRKRPFSQVVVNLLNGGALTEPIRRAGIPVYELGSSNPLALPLTVPRLARLIAQIQPAAIQSWLYYADLVALWALELSGRRSTTRLYWGIRSSDMDQSRCRRALAWTIRACAKRSERPDAVVANSFAGRDAHRRLGYEPRAFPVIPNGIDTLRFKPDQVARAKMRAQLGISADTPLVIHVARVDPMKDHESLVQIAALMPDIVFMMVGSGTQDIVAPKNMMALGIRHDMPEIYPAADLALSTSAFGEGFPNVIAEAMACGIPVVATDVGDSRRIIGDTGSLIPPRDIGAATLTIRKILQAPSATLNHRSNAARTRIEDHYSLSRAVETFDALHLMNVLPQLDIAGS